MLFVLPVAGVHKKQRPSTSVLHLPVGEQRNKNTRNTEVVMRARTVGQQSKGRNHGTGYGK